MSFIEINDLTKVIPIKAQNRMALDKISLGVQSGEAVGLLGPSASGKTTLARLLAGLSHPTAGSIKIDGFAPSDPRSRRALGYLPDRTIFPGHLTPVQALRLTARMAGVPGDETSARMSELLDCLDLAKWTDMKVSKFTPDMTKRLALAVTLIARPECLLVDEPFGKVESATRDLIARRLKAAHADGATLIVLSRSLGSIAPFATRILMINHGRILRETPLGELVLDTKLLEIDADIGDKLIELEPKIGRVISISRKRLMVEPTNENAVNTIIDYLRYKGISIHAVRRRRASHDATWQELAQREEEVTA
ncbi:MAG: ABC transporter ATP-binding protein [candidate division Zixibacteria bacterium]|nr:ABC transporter ATP-binding protein [candidate division Zixibacteria bacterium]